MNKILLGGIVWFAISSTSARAQDVEQKPKRDPQEIFKKLDTNEDGKLSKKEVENVSAEKSKLAKVFTKIDTNNDGFLTPEELKEFRKNNKPKK